LSSGLPSNLQCQAGYALMLLSCLPQGVSNCHMPQPAAASQQGSKAESGAR
jgi:hypothetical protein